MNGAVVCAKALCPAYATVDVCPVHAPDKIIERARAIVNGNFDRVTGFMADPEQEGVLKRLRADILRDLESTI